MISEELPPAVKLTESSTLQRVSENAASFHCGIMPGSGTVEVRALPYFWVWTYISSKS